ncbi:MAG: 50S ribosomal protein L23 [Candidatus Aenigmarchaeota archaeon]|nr:50S ribosomal protein L23 [Candidatus Aenigmarchaeota archaeon]
MGLFNRFKKKKASLTSNSQSPSIGGGASTSKIDKKTTLRPADKKFLRPIEQSAKTLVTKSKLKVDQEKQIVTKQKEEKNKTVQKKEKTYLEEKQAGKILIKPLITEKATNLGQINKYAFVVSRRATRNDIKRAIEEVYHFSPIKINTLNYKGKQIRYGRQSGRTKKWKKAIITLAKGDRIELYEHQ